MKADKTNPSLRGDPSLQRPPLASLRAPQRWLGMTEKSGSRLSFRAQAAEARNLREAISLLIDSPTVRRGRDLCRRIDTVLSGLNRSSDSGAFLRPRTAT